MKRYLMAAVLAVAAVTGVTLMNAQTQSKPITAPAPKADGVPAGYRYGKSVATDTHHGCRGGRQRSRWTANCMDADDPFGFERPIYRV